MKQKIRYLVILCLTVSLIFVQTISAYACIYIPVSNYWYLLDFDIQNAALPTGVTVNALYPNEHGNVEIYDEDGYMVGLWPTLGQLKFTNNSDESIQLGSLSGNTIAPNGTDVYDTTQDMEVLTSNPQSPGGTKPPPPPFLYEFAVIQDSQHFTVPITVTYRLNPSYDENSLVDDASLTDYLILTDAVILAEVIAATEDSRLFEDEENFTYIDGHALVRVEEWLLGEGPEEIEIGEFLVGTSCGDQTVSPGEMIYFLLKTPEDETSIRYALTDSWMGTKAVLPANNENAAAIEAALEELIAPTALPTTDEPMNALFLPYISR